MNTLITFPQILADITRTSDVAHHVVPPMLIILFWILLFLCGLGFLGIGFVAADNPNRVGIIRGTGIISVILFAILGYAEFGF